MKERPRNQWGGYGKQYGTSSERRGYQTYRTDRTQLQSHNAAYESQRQGRYLPTKGTGSGQGGNGGMEMKMIRRNTEILELVRKVIVMKRVIQKTLMSLR